jgi:hypothetical protein
MSSAPQNALASVQLQRIIEAQSVLASAQFDLDSFMNDAVACMQSLTHASGAVIEMAEGSEMVYRACCGSLESFLDFRLPREGSLSGLCVAHREIMVVKTRRSIPGAMALRVLRSALFQWRSCRCFDPTKRLAC